MDHMELFLNHFVCDCSELSIRSTCMCAYMLGGPSHTALVVFSKIRGHYCQYYWVGVHQTSYVLLCCGGTLFIRTTIQLRGVHSIPWFMGPTIKSERLKTTVHRPPKRHQSGQRPASIGLNRRGKGQLILRNHKGSN